MAARPKRKTKTRKPAAKKKTKKSAKTKTKKTAKTATSVKPILSDSPGHLLRRAEQRAAEVYAEELGSDGLTPRQYVVLTAVNQNEGMSQTDLVNLTGIDRSTLADMISRLITRNLLSRKRTKEDLRANAVKITATGKRALRSAQPKVKRAESKILQVLPAGKRREVLRLLKVLGGVD